MKSASHLEKFRRLNRAMARLDPEADRELWIWTAMNAGIHLLNAALHHAGATLEIDSFHTQLEGLYAMPDRHAGTLRDAIHPPGDVMHVDQPPIARPLPAAIERACAALKTIEDLRELYVRGNAPVPRGAAEQWQRAYRECTELLLGEIGASGEISA